MKEDNLDEFFRNKARELDGVPPQMPWDKDDLWNDMDGRLSFKRKRSLLQYSVSIAATISLLIAAWFLYKLNFPEVIVSYKEELVYEENDPRGFNEFMSEEEALSIIREKCKINASLCEAGEFKELKYQLDDLNMKAEEIQKELELFGPTPTVVKAQIRIENMKAGLIKELIKI